MIAPVRLGTVVAVAVLLPAWSQDFKIEDSTFDSGGGKSEGGRYKVEGTIGQPETGTSTGGRYTFKGGFWGGGVQVAGLPQLRIVKGSSEIEIHWTDPDDAYALTESSTLSAGSWSASERQVFYKNGEKTVFLEKWEDEARFFRLERK